MPILWPVGEQTCYEKTQYIDSYVRESHSCVLKVCLDQVCWIVHEVHVICGHIFGRE